MYEIFPKMPTFHKHIIDHSCQIKAMNDDNARIDIGCPHLSTINHSMVGTYTRHGRLATNNTSNTRIIYIVACSLQNTNLRELSYFYVLLILFINNTNPPRW